MTGQPVPNGLDLQGRPIDGVLDPTSPQQAATMHYVDEAIESITGVSTQTPVLQTPGLDAFVRDKVGDYLKQGTGIGLTESSDGTTLTIDSAASSPTVIYGGNAASLAAS